MNIELERLLPIVLSFIEGRGYPASTVTADSLLLHDGILDSFSLVELVMLIEMELNTDLSRVALVPDDFQSVRMLCSKLERS